MIDVERLRADTAGCEAVVHLNNCGASLQPRPVVDAVVEYLRAEERAGGYETAAARAGDAWWRAFSAIRLEPGDRVLVGRSEYQANAFGWLQARERGVGVEVVPNTPAGDLDVDQLSDLLDERVKLVALTMIALSNGAIHPAAAVGERLRAAASEAIYLLDACQAAGQLPLDVAEFGCDFLLYTGRKFIRGPRGTAVLYARREMIERLGPSPFVDGRSASWTSEMSYEFQSDARRFELGEFGYGAKVGLGVATAYMLDVGIEPIAERIQRLSDGLRADLGSVDRVTVHDEGTQRCGIVTFTVDGAAAADVQATLAAAGVNTGVVSRVYSQLDLGGRGLDDVVRLGVHCFNTQEELDRLMSVVDDVAASAGSGT